MTLMTLLLISLLRFLRVSGRIYRRFRSPFPLKASNFAFSPLFSLHVFAGAYYTVHIRSLSVSKSFSCSFRLSTELYGQSYEMSFIACVRCVIRALITDLQVTTFVGSGWPIDNGLTGCYLVGLASTSGSRAMDEIPLFDFIPDFR